MLLDVLCTELSDECDDCDEFEDVPVSGRLAAELEEKLDDRLSDWLLDELTGTLVLSLLWPALLRVAETSSATSALLDVLATDGASVVVPSSPPHAVSSRGKTASKSRRCRCISQLQLNDCATKVGDPTQSASAILRPDPRLLRKSREV